MSTRALRQLARELGVQLAYTDTRKRRRSADTETLLAVVRALGWDVETPREAPSTLERLHADRDARAMEPVVVAWDGVVPRLAVTGSVDRTVAVRAELEDGRELAVRAATDPSEGGRSAIDVGWRLPVGLHRLVVEPGGRRAEMHSTLISAPTILRGGTRERLAEREWGVFLPLHALVTERGWGIGDLDGLSELADWIRSLGGGIVATLPLLAGFADEPSPYAPASRLFWDERYVDVEREAGSDAATRRLIGSVRFAEALDRVRRSDLVEHAEVAALKRQALERLAAARAGDRELHRFVRERPEVETYARFRAAGERWGRDWRSWPPAARDGSPSVRSLDPSAVAYHRFAQFVAERQVAEVGRRSSDAGAGLYVDMPLGTHPDGYDVWRYRDGFATGVSVGAAPDDFFQGGQDWGFPPVDPHRERDRGYAYVRASLRHVLRHAGVIRLDHVIGLHRQYWVPNGFAADRGVMVTYPAEEWYAVLSLEAARHDTTVVGEDLGTVPPSVRAGMRRHGLLRSYVVQYEAVPGRERLEPPTASSLAALNTHDMATFASFWRASDIDDRIEDGLLAPEDRDRERQDRAEVRRVLVATLREAGLLRGVDPDERDVLVATLGWLAASPARFVVVNLEDLWGELEPVNVPGVTSRPNWRRRAARTLEQLRRDEAVASILRRVDAARSGTAPRAGEDAA